MAAGVDTNPGVGASHALNDYWTKGEGLTKWAMSPHPYTALVTALSEHVPAGMVHGLAAEYYQMVFHVHPGRHSDGGHRDGAKD
jgi:hypothetical protein